MLLFLHHITGLFHWILEACLHFIEKYSVLSKYFFLSRCFKFPYNSLPKSQHTTVLYGIPANIWSIGIITYLSTELFSLAWHRHTRGYQCHVIFNTLQLIITSTRKIEFHTYIKTSLFHLFSFHYIMEWTYGKILYIKNKVLYIRNIIIRIMTCVKTITFVGIYLGILVLFHIPANTYVQYYQMLWTSRKIINNFRHRGTSHWQDLCMPNTNPLNVERNILYWNLPPTMKSLIVTYKYPSHH